MKYTAALVALVGAASVAAHSNVTYVTEVVTAITTYCPASTSLVHNGKTYHVTEATTLTITDCPCTVTRPVYTSSVVYCDTCHNKTAAPTGGPKPSKPSSVYTAGAAQAVALSGAGLAGLLGLAAYIL